MMKPLVGVIAVLMLQAPTASAELFTLPCPAPESIVYSPIPYSVNGLYSAATRGIGFMGYDANVLQPHAMHFVRAEVGQVNSYWSLYCVYQDGAQHLTLATDNSPVYRNCRFSSGAATCEGSLEQCLLLCPVNPKILTSR
jgi:hypothetical protein